MTTPEPAPAIAYDIGGLFRVENLDIPGRDLPYEFVHRIGAVTILPILTDENGNSSVLTISNQRLHYGTIFETPGGNLDGGFDEPEDPRLAAIRELREETGYQPEDATSVEVFKMRDISRTILYPRYFAIARNLTHTDQAISSPGEIVTVVPTPLDEYLDSLLGLSREEAFPEVTLAFTKAARAFGRPALTRWIVRGASQIDISSSFSPWLTRREPVEGPNHW